jgi:hypothetical protein
MLKRGMVILRLHREMAVDYLRVSAEEHRYIARVIYRTSTWGGRVIHCTSGEEHRYIARVIYRTSTWGGRVIYCTSIRGGTQIHSKSDMSDITSLHSKNWSSSVAH